MKQNITFTRIYIVYQKKIFLLQYRLLQFTSVIYLHVLLLADIFYIARLIISMKTVYTHSFTVVKHFVPEVCGDVLLLK